MNYEEFKELIESTNLSSEEFYKTLLETEGKESLDFLYQRYIKEIVPEDEEANKYSRVEYYLDLIEAHNSKRELYSENAFSQYLNYISTIKIMTKEEREELLKQICELRNGLNDSNITTDSITEELKSININIEFFNKKELQDKISYVKTLDNVDENILNHLKQYYEYESKVETFMEQNLRLVVKISRMISFKVGDTGSMDINDLVQEGNIGLRKAIDKFEVKKDCQFSTYAYFWISQSVGIGIDKKSRLIRIPAHTHEAYVKICRKEVELTNTLGRKPSEKELAEALEMTIERIREIRQGEKAIVSLDAPVNNDDDCDMTLGDTIACSGNDIEKNIDAMCDNQEMYEILKDANLDERYLLVIVLRYGLNFEQYISYPTFKHIFQKLYSETEMRALYRRCLEDQSPKTLEEVGKLLQLTRERIRQIEFKVLRQLRRRITLRQKTNMLGVR